MLTVHQEYEVRKFIKDMQIQVRFLNSYISDKDLQGADDATVQVIKSAISVMNHQSIRIKELI